MTAPFSASWFLTMFATCVEMIYVTAFLVGFFSAIIQLATQVRIISYLLLRDSGWNGTYQKVIADLAHFPQVYISEISHPSIRGSLCSASRVLSHIGLLSSFALGAWLDWRQLALVCAGSPLMLLITAR